ncbi:helicase-related protein [Patescibacteria group bacterium]
MLRDNLLKFLRKQFVGPDTKPRSEQDNGEEILKFESPRQRYLLGILYPKKYDESNIDNQKDEILADTSDSDKKDATADIEIRLEGTPTDHSGEENPAEFEEIVNLTNAYLPSAIGLSCIVKNSTKKLNIKVSAGRYKKASLEADNKKFNVYLREPIVQNINIDINKLFKKSTGQRKIHINKNNIPTGLIFYIVKRKYSYSDRENVSVFSFSLVNSLESENNYHDNERCFFQSGFSVSILDPATGFYPYAYTDTLDHKDAQSNRLLYRHKKSYAVGHGCAAKWEKTNNNCNNISTETFPSYDLKPIIPRDFKSLKFSMLDLSDNSTFDKGINCLEKLCVKYGKWIKRKEEESLKLKDKTLTETAKRHTDKCREILKGMQEGLSLILKNKDLKSAFQLMNRSMLLQQLHSNLKLRKWTEDDDRLLKTEKTNPEIKLNDKNTWPDKGKKFGNWRPFQIAFILLNVKSLYQPSSPERNIVDVIWFPTGGGKTEAYLGLSSLAILIRRIKNNNDTGTTVIMRYTLRLLTTQQFQRAASLICALDIIRKGNKQLLGKNRITIGLWVGESLTPNSRSQAKINFREIESGQSSKYPFLLTKCPWCGAEIGIVSKKNGAYKLVGLRQYQNPSTIKFCCYNKGCNFSDKMYHLPLTVIDEDIYNDPPELIIGTVDKFATAIWKPDEVKSLFGYRDNKRVSPPSLIIQDELHLISGALGTMVSTYETIIEELCKYPTDKKIIRPKIVASTATISRASEQISALYARKNRNIRIFPQQALKAGDSFFAEERTDKNGRLYVGIHASGYTQTTTHIRIIATLLQGAKSLKATDQERNYYWTILDYYNSLRELGHAVTRVEGDVKEFMEGILFKRMNLFGKKERRYISCYSELTSRKDASEISRILSQLEADYNSKRHPLDICFATNMVSVGVDIQRLGLMTVYGQPKSTSEYIQATSRVGRSAEGPGLVINVYSPLKPRDRSHFENFYSYHSKIYSHVEAVSITPFSIPASERLLHVILIGLIRFFGNKDNMNSPQPPPANKLFQKVKEIIVRRVNRVNPSESANVEELFIKLKKTWKKYNPPKYSDYRDPWNNTLFYDSSLVPPDEASRKRTWPVPRSMRNVEPECMGNIVPD